MVNRYNGKTKRGPRLKGLERRNNACRRTDARRKSDNSRTLALAVQDVSAVDNDAVRHRLASKPPAMLDDTGLLRSILEQVPAKIMLCDQELNITFVNRALTEMLVQREPAMRELFPGFDARKLLGTGIDQFHNTGLPMNAELRVAENLVLELNATAIVTSDGQCTGRMVVWEEVTDRETTDRKRVAVLVDMVAATEEQSRSMARLNKTIARLDEAIRQYMPAVEEVEVAAPLSPGVRRNLRARRSVSRRVLVSGSDD